MVKNANAMRVTETAPLLKAQANYKTSASTRLICLCNFSKGVIRYTSRNYGALPNFSRWAAVMYFFLRASAQLEIKNSLSSASL